MKRSILLVSVFAGLLGMSVPFSEDSANSQRLGGGEIAFHFLARTSFSPTAGFNLVGYVPYINGIDGPIASMFNGTPGESTAYFTIMVRQETFSSFTTLSPSNDNSLVRARLFEAGPVFDVIYDPTPDQDWADPSTFGDGLVVATFKESVLMGTNVTQSGVGYNMFSSALIGSKRFIFNGQMIDFKNLVPNGVTTNNVTGPGGFTGTAVAIGQKPQPPARDEGDN